MQHIAIMNAKLGLIPDILSSKKKIESRWYKNKRDPWNKINSCDIVYFKDSGKPITAMAEVERVEQYELNKEIVKKIVKKYGGEGKIFLNNKNSENEYYSRKKYCILIFLKNPKEIKPFKINKKGFGTGCAWICTENIEKIKN